MSFQSRLSILLVLLLLAFSILACDLTPVQVAIEDALKALWEEIKRAVLNEIERIVEEIRRQIAQEVENIVNGITEFGEQIITSIVTWINEAVETIEQFINELISGATPTPPAQTFYTTGTANARECPRLNCEIIVQIEPDTPISVTRSVAGDMYQDSTLWYQAFYNESEVYIHSSLVTDIAPSPPTPIQDPLPNPTPPQVSEPPELKFPWPCCTGTGLSQGFSNSHPGIDFDFPNDVSGDYILAARTGTIVKVVDNDEWNMGWGNYVRISHGNGYETLYAHLTSGTVIDLPPDSPVTQGTILGEVGCSGRCEGDHLHFELWQGKNPISPTFVDGNCSSCNPKIGETYTSSLTPTE